MSKITTHILDTAKGCPAEGVRVNLYRLYRQVGEAGRMLPSSGEEKIAEGTTNKDGRIAEWLGADGQDVNAGAGLLWGPGIYKIRFEIKDYFDKQVIPSFYPWVDIVFELAGDGHYHVPLLVSPYGYSTYRGS